MGGGIQAALDHQVSTRNEEAGWYVHLHRSLIFVMGGLEGREYWVLILKDSLVVVSLSC